MTFIVLFRVLLCPCFCSFPDILTRARESAGNKFPITVIGDEKRPGARCRIYARSSVVHFSIFEKSFRRRLRWRAWYFIDALSFALFPLTRKHCAARFATDPEINAESHAIQRNSIAGVEFTTSFWYLSLYLDLLSSDLLELLCLVQINFPHVHCKLIILPTIYHSLRAIIVFGLRVLRLSYFFSLFFSFCYSSFVIIIIFIFSSSFQHLCIYIYFVVRLFIFVFTSSLS